MESEIKEKFCTEFVLESNAILSKNQLKEKIGHYGDSLIIVNTNNKYKVHIHTNKPNDLFEEVSQYGTCFSLSGRHEKATSKFH